MKIAAGFALIIPFIVVAVILAVRSISFELNCTDYLKRAADANTVEKALTELNTAITYMERENLTTGFTSILYNTPDEDVYFWYSNIKAAQEELEKVDETTSALEKSNVLMKLRETLLDNTEKGTFVTAPAGISKYPHNGVFALLLVLSIILGIVGVILIIVELDW